MILKFPNHLDMATRRESDQDHRTKCSRRRRFATFCFSLLVRPARLSSLALSEYARILFALCSAQRPDLLQRSKRDILFFDESFDPEVEDWTDVTEQQAL